MLQGQQKGIGIQQVSIYMGQKQQGYVHHRQGQTIPERKIPTIPKINSMGIPSIQRKWVHGRDEAHPKQIS
jgi:hypothetical protein